MARLLHRGAALVAAYAIALQAVLVGLPPAPTGLDPFAVLCASDFPSDHGTLPARHNPTCQACPVACGGGATAMTPSPAVVSPVALAEGSWGSAFSAQALPPLPKYRLQASRAPPAAA